MPEFRANDLELPPAQLMRVFYSFPLLGLGGYCFSIAAAYSQECAVLKLKLNSRVESRTITSSQHSADESWPTMPFLIRRVAILAATRCLLNGSILEMFNRDIDRSSA
jgi:hypothetical protein